MAKTTSRIVAADLVADSLGRLMEFWGFKRTMGRMWGTLFLSPTALPAAGLCERLGISAGAASMTLADLERWGVVHRLFRPGERREFFEAETNLWKMISRVYEERERREIDRLIEALENALKTLAAEETKGDEDRFVRDRLQNLLSLAKLGRSMVSRLLSNAEADLKPIRDKDLA
jgi:DNA-binding transcriptional regulator GbsR (MarR family)